MPDRTDPPTRPPTPAARYDAVVAVLAPQVDVWQRMLTAHVRDSGGHCAAQVCREPGTGRPHLVHPCPSRLLAQRAQQQHQGDPR
jgi:hypothetical protein